MQLINQYSFVDRMSQRRPWNNADETERTITKCHYLRSDFTNSSQLASLLNANYYKPTAKSDSRFTKQK